MIHILLLTSTCYECDNVTNMVHKVASVFKLNGCIITSNSSCRHIDNVQTGYDNLVYIGNTVDIIVTLFTTYPQGQTCLNVDEEPYLNLIVSINRPSNTYHIDYWERSWTNKTLGEPHLLREEPFNHTFLHDFCNGYFKRELYSDMEECFPFPEPTMSCNDRVLSTTVKKYDILCSFPQKDTGLRRACISVSEMLLNDGYNVLIRDDLSPEEYKKAVRSSFITLDAHGAGQINHRFLEIIALRSVCCRQRYTVEFYNDYDSSMIIEYDNPVDLYAKLKGFLQLKYLLVDMEERAYNHYRTYHMLKSVGTYLLSHMYIEN